MSTESAHLLPTTCLVTMEMPALLMTSVPTASAEELALLAMITTCVPRIPAILSLVALLPQTACLAMTAMPALKWTSALPEDVLDLLLYSATTAILASLNSAILSLVSATQLSPMLSALTTMHALPTIAAPTVHVLVLHLSAMTRTPAQMTLARLASAYSLITPTLAMMEIPAL